MAQILLNTSEDEGFDVHPVGSVGIPSRISSTDVQRDMIMNGVAFKMNRQLKNWGYGTAIFAVTSAAPAVGCPIVIKESGVAVRRIVRLAIGLVASALISMVSVAGPISVSDGGANITVSYDINGQVVSFDYLFAMGATGDFIGTTMDALSIQFGGNNNALVSSISTTSTNSENVKGVWTGFQDKVSGNGCAVGDFDAACYTQLVSGEGGSGSETVIAASTDYLFNFDVTFKAGVPVPTVLAGDHSIKFLSLKLNTQNGKWTTGVLLSESGRFYPNDPIDPDPIPVPGTLVLLGLGLLGVGWSRSRPSAA